MVRQETSCGGRNVSGEEIRCEEIEREEKPEDPSVIISEEDEDEEEDVSFVISSSSVVVKLHFHDETHLLLRFVAVRSLYVKRHCSIKSKMKWSFSLKVMMMMMIEE